MYFSQPMARKGEWPPVQQLSRIGSIVDKPEVIQVEPISNDKSASV